MTYLGPAEREQRLGVLLGALSCDDVVRIDDDLAFYDDTLGADCYSSDGEVAFVRVYRSSASVGQNLVDWKPTFDARRHVVSGGNWFVIGPPAQLARVPVGSGHAEAGTTVPEAVPLTPMQDRVTTCGRFMETAIRAYIFSPDDYAGRGSAFRRAFPGADAMIRATLKSTTLHTLRARDEEKVMSAAATYVPKLKALCFKVSLAEVSPE